MCNVSPRKTVGGAECMDITRGKKISLKNSHYMMFLKEHDCYSITSMAKIHTFFSGRNVLEYRWTGVLESAPIVLKNESDENVKGLSNSQTFVSEIEVLAIWIVFVSDNFTVCLFSDTFVINISNPKSFPVLYVKSPFFPFLTGFLPHKFYHWYVYSKYCN